MTDPVRVVVADDHPLFLNGVITSLRSAGDFAIVGQATDAASAARLTKELLPDLVLLDIRMPGGGLQAAQHIATVCPAVKIVMLTVSEDEDDLLAAMKAGASGYVLKGVSAHELVDVVRSVVAGHVYVAPSLAWSLLREMSHPRPTTPLAELTTRERDVLELVARGRSNAEIGQQLSIAEKTVKHYMTNIMTKLHVRSRVEAALVAHQARQGEAKLATDRTTTSE